MNTTTPQCPPGQSMVSVHVEHPINSPELRIEPRTFASYSGALSGLANIWKKQLTPTNPGYDETFLPDFRYHWWFYQGPIFNHILGCTRCPNYFIYNYINNDSRTSKWLTNIRHDNYLVYIIVKSCSRLYLSYTYIFHMYILMGMF